MTALTTLPGRDADRVPAPAEGWCPEGTWCSAPSTTSSGTGPAGDDGHRDQGGHAAGAHSEGQGHERRRRHQLERAHVHSTGAKETARSRSRSPARGRSTSATSWGARRRILRPTTTSPRWKPSPRPSVTRRFAATSKRRSPVSELAPSRGDRVPLNGHGADASGRAACERVDDAQRVEGRRLRLHQGQDVHPGVRGTRQGPARNAGRRAQSREPLWASDAVLLGTARRALPLDAHGRAVRPSRLQSRISVSPCGSLRSPAGSARAIP
jgi:hypothetical protein